MKIRILIVDDDVHQLALAESFLSNSNDDFELFLADSTEAGFKRVDELNPDIIVSDCMMDGKDGLKFLKMVRATGNDIPFIILTGHSREDVAIKALNLGATSYLKKGGDPKVLFNELGLLIRSAFKNKEARESIRTAQEFLRAVLDSAADGIAVFDSEGQIVYHNEIFAEMWNITDELLKHEDFKKLESHLLDQLDIPDDFESYVEGLLSDDSVRFDTVRLNDGRLLERYTRPLLIEGKVLGYVWSFRDLTEYEKTEILLHDERDRARTYLNLAGTVIVAVDTNLDITMINHEGCRVLGCMEKVALGRNWVDTFIPKEEQEIVRSNLMGLLSDRVQPTMADESPILDSSGDIHWIQWSDVAIRNKDGQVIGILSAGLDITRKREVEIQLRKQKEELSEFARYMAHDIGNQLYGIRGYAQLLLKENNDEFLSRIITGIDNIQKLLRRSVSLADAGLVVGEKKPVDLAKLLDVISREVIPDHIVFKSDKLPICLCDKEKMSQVIRNLLLNAVHHGKPTIIKVLVREKPNGLGLIFQNNGTRIENDIRGNLLESKVLSRDKGGLGLVIVKKIVEAHGWEIELERTPETSFTIHISPGQYHWK
ncbi:MAG: PAS domain S-box protein [Candidatus Thorarchaeota archaeon]